MDNLHDLSIDIGQDLSLVGAVTTSRRTHVCHVGDVRAYLCRHGNLARLTDDHSVVFEAVRAGALTVEQARAHPKRNFVTQAVGLAEGTAPSTTTASLAAGDLLLLCSDGLWETLSEAELAAALASERPPRAIAESLLESALGRAARTTYPSWSTATTRRGDPRRPPLESSGAMGRMTDDEVEGLLAAPEIGVLATVDLGKVELGDRIYGHVGFGDFNARLRADPSALGSAATQMTATFMSAVSGLGSASWPVLAVS